jgi:endogenous inhibitor of DNA gyrase (YacG/DUF329 family)
MPAPRVRCPTCQREVAWTAESQYRPFCSERCRMVDLGAWFAEERSLPVEPVATDGERNGHGGGPAA